MSDDKKERMTPIQVAFLAIAILGALIAAGYLTILLD